MSSEAREAGQQPNPGQQPNQGQQHNLGQQQTRNWLDRPFQRLINLQRLSIPDIGIQNQLLEDSDSDSDSDVEPEPEPLPLESTEGAVESRQE